MDTTSQSLSIDVQFSSQNMKFKRDVRCTSACTVFFEYTHVYGS